MSLLGRQPVVAAATAGKVAGVDQLSLVLNLDVPSGVNALAVAAQAGLFPSSSGHTRMLSQSNKAAGRCHCGEVFLFVVDIGAKEPPMRCLFKLLLLCPVLAVSTSGQTARDYFNELKTANTFNHYKDEQVCFPDEDVPSFAIIAKVSDVIEDMKKTGNASGLKKLMQAKASLLVQTFHKGVASNGYIYDPVKKDQTDEHRDYSMEFKSPKPGRMVYSINWTTGRYLLRMYIFQKSRTIPAKEESGRCELIYPEKP